MAPTTARRPEPDLYRTVPADSAAPQLLRDACRHWLRRLGWPDEEAEELLTAATEAVTNVVDHAYHPPAPDQLHQLVWFEATHTTHPSGHRRVIITVADTGQWKPAEVEGGVSRMRDRVSTLDIEATPTGTTVRLRSHALGRRPRGGSAARRRTAAHVPTPRAPRGMRPPLACATESAGP
jgi:hypothetical protein